MRNDAGATGQPRGVFDARSIEGRTHLLAGSMLLVSKFWMGMQVMPEFDQFRQNGVEVIVGKRR